MVVVGPSRRHPPGLWPSCGGGIEVVAGRGPVRSPAHVLHTPPGWSAPRRWAGRRPDEPGRAPVSRGTGGGPDPAGASGHGVQRRPRPGRLRRLGAPSPPHLLRPVRIGPRRGKDREIALDRAELFERVWSEPVATVVAQWGLSDQGLRKACRRLQIPLPPRGYWAKVRAGKRVRRPRLPKLPKGQDEEFVIWAPE